MEAIYYPRPYQGGNNRKHTRGRMKERALVQSIPCWNEEGEFLGYKYIRHVKTIHDLNRKTKTPISI